MKTDTTATIGPEALITGLDSVMGGARKVTLTKKGTLANLKPELKRQLCDANEVLVKAHTEAAGAAANMLSGAMGTPTPLGATQIRGHDQHQQRRGRFLPDRRRGLRSQVIRVVVPFARVAESSARVRDAPLEHV
jgi:hypothetical protein